MVHFCHIFHGLKALIHMLFQLYGQGGPFKPHVAEPILNVLLFLQYIRN